MRQATEAVCIVGPTASGKSSLAQRVACELKSAVVSVDAMQVYRGMNIGTAKMPLGERTCPLLMVDVADMWESYSVARFQREARACVDALNAQEKPAVLCGGTGLYLDAVIDEMDFPYGETDGEGRKRYELIARTEGATALHELLKKRDPESAKLIEPANVRRVVRALEMIDGGTSYAVQHRGLKSRAPHYSSVLWAICMDRTRLYARIEERVDLMFEQGLVDEVRALAEAGLTRESTAGQAIGYREVMAALAGECSLDEARETMKTRTRHYAKRQLSWLKRDGRCRWLDYDQMGEDEALQMVLAAMGEER